MPNRICDMFVIARPYRPPYYVTVDTKTTPSGNVIMTTILCIVIYSEICYLWIKIRQSGREMVITLWWKNKR